MYVRQHNRGRAQTPPPDNCNTVLTFMKRKDSEATKASEGGQGQGWQRHTRAGREGNLAASTNPSGTGDGAAQLT